MRLSLIALMFALLLPATVSAQDIAPPELTRQVSEAAGGPDALYKKTRSIRFTFVVEGMGVRVMEAKHVWDLVAQTDHVTWRGVEGAWDVVVHVGDQRAVSATLNGKPVEEAKMAEAAKLAYQRWVNDSYWLLMPIKLLDSGAMTRDAGMGELGGKPVKLLELSFKGVGLTPGDQYTLFIDPATNRVLEWELRLEGRADKPSRVTWADYQQRGPLTLALDHRWSDGARRLLFEDVVVTPR
jgi:hypothetical protein